MAHNVKRKYIGVVGSTYLDELSQLRHSVLSDKSGNLHSDFRSLTPSKLPQSSLDNPLFSSQSLECQEGKPSAESKENLKTQVDSESSLTESIDSQKPELAHKEQHELLVATHSNSKIFDEKCGLQGKHEGSYLSGNDPKCFSPLPHLSRKRSFFRKAELPKDNAPQSTPTILISPSWGPETLLTKYGLTLLEPLAQAGFSLIIRPHPQSLIGEAESKNIAHLQESLQKYKNVVWDIGTPNVYAFAKADMMISDFSSVIFDFVCLEAKPVLTLDFAFDPAGYDLSDIDMEHFYTFETLKRIGGKLREQDFAHIASIITQILESNKSQEAKKCKEELWRYPHHAGLKAAQEILKIERELLEHSLKAYMPQVRRIREIDSMLERGV
ncbi:MAG TPA: CDP-glycerol glycerophosphotransferase family protein [Candidatus Helicobacter avicola]|nr:CDP-glycerol glycerophosphotransferase family protein [Candidatus Helicobacter avicola]